MFTPQWFPDNWPRIEPYLQSIEGRKDFIHVVKDGYQVIDYVYQDKDSWDDLLRLECRGLKFDTEGRLIGRGFHKFFNLGEKVQAHEIDWSRPHIIMDKLDGSMIHPVILGGDVVFMTRMGRTDHAIRAERHLTKRMKQQLYNMLQSGYAPIFEWTAPDNRIVLEYDDDCLTLLAVRDLMNGDYFDRSVVEMKAEWLGLPAVEVLDPRLSSDVDALYECTGVEGFVIWFTDDDHFIKVKTDEYVRQHRAVSFFERADKVLEAVLNEDIDDILPVLTVEQRNKLLEYSQNVNHIIDGLALTLTEIVTTARDAGMDRKTFALEIASQADPRIKGCYFSILDGKDPREAVKQAVARNHDIINVAW